MTKCLIILSLLISLTSCSSLMEDMYKAEKVSGVDGIDFKVSKHKILSYESTDGTYGYFYGNTTPVEVKAIFEKALSWNEQSKAKNLDFKKEIDSFIMGSLTFDYNHKAKSEDSFVSVCFKNAKYTHLVDIKCGIANMAQVKSVISELSGENVDAVIANLAAQKEAESELK